MLFRIWIDDTKQMATCSEPAVTSADYMIACDGSVWLWQPCGMIEVQNAYVMRATGYPYDEGCPGNILYELDIVECEGGRGNDSCTID